MRHAVHSTSKLPPKWYWRAVCTQPFAIRWNNTIVHPWLERTNCLINVNVLLQGRRLREIGHSNQIDPFVFPDICLACFLIKPLRGQTLYYATLEKLFADIQSYGRRHLILALCHVVALLCSEPRPNKTAMECTRNDEKLIQHGLLFFFFYLSPLSFPLWVTPSPMLARPIKLKLDAGEGNCSYGAQCALPTIEKETGERAFIAKPSIPFIYL